jgi:hypothetical protein
VKQLPEVRILSKLKHPNIIAMKNVFYDKDNQQAKLLLEFCHQDLYQKFCKDKKKRLPEI